MKKFTKVFIFTLVTLLAMVQNAMASVSTEIRTESNLKVREGVFNYSNKNAILSTPKVDESEKVYDFAELLTSSEEEDLYLIITEFIDSYNMDMAVVTIDENSKGTAKNYADDFYDYNYFGKGQTYDGVLFLIDMDTREMWISTTGEAIRIYDDSRISRILDSTYLEIAEKDYFNCAKDFVVLASEYAKAGVPKSNKNTYIDEAGEYVVSEDNRSFTEKFADNFWIMVFVSAIATLIFIVIAASKHKTVKKALSAREYLEGFSITNSQDVFLSTYTTSVYIPPANYSTGGYHSSSGGGSSVHHSSSGRSHGGGGRHF